MRVISDIGSTHGGSIDECFSSIDIARAHNVSDVKFQMLTERQLKGGNIAFDHSIMNKLVEYGNELNVNVFASCFDHESIDKLIDSGAKSIKIAYSEHTNKDLIDHACLEFDEVFVSCDFMSPEMPEKVTKLYCIPLYPVPYLVSFSGLSVKFDGFSDHTIGISQTMIACHEFDIIEKHVIQDSGVDCPDSKFAVTWKELERIAKL